MAAGSSRLTLTRAHLGDDIRQVSKQKVHPPAHGAAALSASHSSRPERFNFEVISYRVSQIVMQLRCQRCVFPSAQERDQD